MCRTQLQVRRTQLQSRQTAQVGEGVRHVGVPHDDRGCGCGVKQAHEVGHLQLAQIGGEDLRVASELLYLASELLYIASESRLLVTATVWAGTKHVRAGPSMRTECSTNPSSCAVSMPVRSWLNDRIPNKAM